CSWARPTAEQDDEVTEETREELIRIGELLIRPSRYAAYVSGKPVDLTATEFRLLKLLASRPYHVFARDLIVDEVYGHDSDTSGRLIDSHIYTLRRALGVAGRYVETVRGVGYRMVNANRAVDTEK